MPNTAYESGRIGLLLIDTVNEVFSEKGKSYGEFKEEFDRIGTFENLKRLLAGAREQEMPVFFAPMSFTEEDYTSWQYICGIQEEMYDNRLFEAGTWNADFHPDRQGGKSSEYSGLRDTWSAAPQAGVRACPPARPARPYGCRRPAWDRRRAAGSAVRSCRS